jgi:hypothetical protein
MYIVQYMYNIYKWTKTLSDKQKYVVIFIYDIIYIMYVPISIGRPLSAFVSTFLNSAFILPIQFIYYMHIFIYIIYILYIYMYYIFIYIIYILYIYYKSPAFVRKTASINIYKYIYIYNQS